MRRHLVALVAVTSLVTFGQSVYTWEDADGLHFTDNPAQVPPKAKVKVLAPSAPLGAPGPVPQDAAPTGPQVSSPSSPEPRAAPASAADSGPAESAPPTATGVPTVAPNPPTVSPEPAADRDAPLDERAWRARFVSATRRVGTLRDRVTTLERGRASRADCVPEPLTAAEVSAPGGTTRCRSSATQDRLQARLAEVHGELREAELELEALDREASSLSVPREWRRGW
jgi:hypothetical protein